MILTFRLDRDTLRNILTEPKNSIIKQYVKLFEMDGIKLTFDEKVYEFIVDKALEFKLGARGLRSIVEAVMMDAMYSMPSQKVKELHVTLEYAKEKFEKTNAKMNKREKGYGRRNHYQYKCRYRDRPRV